VCIDAVMFFWPAVVTNVFILCFVVIGLIILDVGG
jgi:hypothetical protein